MKNSLRVEVVSEKSEKSFVNSTSVESRVSNKISSGILVQTGEGV